MRKLLVLLVVLLALLVVADRGALALTERSLRQGLQDSGGLTTAPQVDVQGTPFLTQAIRGRYDRVDVTAAGVQAGELRLAQLDIVLTGAQVPLSDVVAGEVTEVPVDLVEARALVSYADLSRRSGSRQLTVSPVGDRLRVTGSAEVLGRTLSVSATSSLTIEGDELVITAEEFDSGAGLADDLISRALGGLFDLRIPLTGLPYGLRVQSVDVQSQGVVVQARARDAVLRPLPPPGP